MFNKQLNGGLTEIESCDVLGTLFSSVGEIKTNLELYKFRRSI